MTMYRVSFNVSGSSPKEAFEKATKRWGAKPIAIISQRLLSERKKRRRARVLKWRPEVF